MDTCGNALVRKQTGASLLPDCRAYELVSAADTGGYDVESSLVPGQHPLAGYPDATDPARVLYTVHFGAIPGVGDPPNYGDDPYVATRGEEGWTTKYVGVPVATAPDPTAFGSSLTGADASLDVMAFGGPGFCNPCMEDGTSGIPIRRANGQLEQGMKGSIAVPDPTPAGEVRKQFSADGDHFVFGSEDKFEPAGNSASVSIYDRDLPSSATQVVSTMPNGSTMTGEVAELDVSDDGSRILIGKWVGTDAAGNAHYDLFMHVGNNPNSVAVADTPNGVIYNGMTSDGTKVYFTTADALATDGDTSADLFRADVGPSSAAITRVSTGTGGTGDTDCMHPERKLELARRWYRLRDAGDRRRRRRRRRRWHRVLPLARVVGRAVQRDGRGAEPVRRRARRFADLPGDSRGGRPGGRSCSHRRRDCAAARTSRCHPERRLRRLRLARAGDRLSDQRSFRRLPGTTGMGRSSAPPARQPALGPRAMPSCRMAEMA